jgi:hypothetical protein
MSSICGASVLILVCFVRPLVNKWIEVRQDAVKVRRLARLYEQYGCERRDAIEKAREDVFGRKTDVPALPAAQSSTHDITDINLQPGIMQLLSNLLRRH